MVSQAPVDFVKVATFAAVAAAVVAVVAVAGCAGRPSANIGEAPTAAQAPRTLSGAQVRLDYDLDIRRLSNGLTVILAEDHTVPVISYQTWVRVGSVDEKPGKTGLAHLFEHLMFKGTERYDARAFFTELEAKGAEVNAFTTRDYNVYYQNFTRPLLAKTVELESARLAGLKLTDEVLNTERHVVFEERRLRTENSPSGRMGEALWRLAFGVHPYGNPVIGYPEDLIALNLKDLQAFFAEHYHPANVTVVVVGDIRADETFKMIEAAYGDIPRKEVPERRFSDEPESRAESRARLFDEVATARFSHGYVITPAGHEDTYALDVLATILFNGTSSRAHRRLVEEKRLLLGVSGVAYTPMYSGLFMVEGTVKGDAPPTVAEAEIERLIAEIQDKGVTEEEVGVAVRQLTVQLVDNASTPFGLGQLIGTVHTILGDARRFSDEVRLYNEVTPADVQRVAARYLTPNRRTAVVLLPNAWKGKQGVEF